MHIYIYLFFAFCLFIHMYGFDGLDRGAPPEWCRPVALRATLGPLALLCHVRVQLCYSEASLVFELTVSQAAHR